MTIVHADKLVHRTIRFIDSIKESKCKHMLETENSVKEIEFFSVKLTDYNRIVSPLRIGIFEDNHGLQRLPGQWWTRYSYNLIPLINCSNLSLVSSECERGLITMNLIVMDTRSRLLIGHASNLMFIKLHGPPIEQWKPDNYVRKWLRNHRSATDTQIKAVKDT
uniref:Uncharacterized protein n=1 Tax=Timema poppense TaxID=170557 RepID=A0A7R9DQ19_TIMPO|nr:unnamed protein product [Timema poppensis]